MPRRVINYLRAAIHPDTDGPTDAELLGRFAAERDAAAFELLVWRHASLVLRVCRGVLRDHHAAEDAAQAVFLALARQARSVRGVSVTGWLFRVARRVAMRAASRRQAQPAASTLDPDTLPAPTPLPDPDPDADRVLHEELARLPERYRVPILLCFFEGLTHTAAALQLGCPVGTVAGRLARAKDLLARQLTRRGVSIAILATCPTMLVPPSFAVSTTAAAIAFLLKRGAGVSASVLELANREVHVMAATHALWTAAVVVTCGALALGVGWAAAPSGDGPPVVAAAPPAATAPVPKPVAAKLTEPVKTPDPSEAVVDLLSREVSLLTEPNNPTSPSLNINETPLFELLQFLSKRHSITFMILEGYFVPEMENVRERKPSLSATDLRGLTLHQFLTAILDSMGATYIINRGTIEVVPIYFAAKETKSAIAGEGVARLAEPLVSASIKEQPLKDAAALLAERYNLTVIVCPQGGEARNKMVTARLMNTPADKALELLAVQCDLRVVRNGKAFLITTREHSQELLSDEIFRERGKVEIEKLRAPLPKPVPTK